MAGLFPTNRARVAVQAFLASKGPETRDADRSGTLNGDSPSEEEEELLDVTISRPARLGLGATYNSKLQKPSLTESDRRMAGSIRAEAEREKARTDDDGDHESSDSESEDHPDSRAAFLGARVSKRKGLSMLKESSDSSLRKHQELGIRSGNFVANTGNLEELLKRDAPSPYPSSRSSAVTICNSLPALPSPVDASQEADRHIEMSRKLTPNEIERNVETKSEKIDAVVITKKRKKTRSRQKNLRRDKRPKELLPLHLNANTLKKRLTASNMRVQTAEGSNENNSAWYFDRNKREVPDV